jgi:hypothetical protein
LRAKLIVTRLEGYDGTGVCLECYLSEYAPETEVEVTTIEEFAATLLRVQAARPGQTVVHVQKAGWASQYHGKTLKLAWAPGETFQLTVDRDLLPAVEELLSDGTWRTIDEIREHVEAGTKAVRDLLAEHEDRFAMRTGEQARALGRSRKSHLYGTAQITRLTPESSRVESTVKGARESYSTTRLTLEESSSSSRVGSPPPNSTQARSGCFESKSWSRRMDPRLGREAATCAGRRTPRLERGARAHRQMSTDHQDQYNEPTRVDDGRRPAPGIGTGAKSPLIGA